MLHAFLHCSVWKKDHADYIYLRRLVLSELEPGGIHIIVSLAVVEKKPMSKRSHLLFGILFRAWTHWSVYRQWLVTVAGFVGLENKNLPLKMQLCTQLVQKFVEELLLDKFLHGFHTQYHFVNSFNAITFFKLKRHQLCFSTFSLALPYAIQLCLEA